FMQRVAHTADLIITDSHHSKRDIRHHLAVPEEKIRVIYLGYDPRYQPMHDAQALQPTLRHYAIRQPYLLFVGVLEPKKNLDRLLEAFAIFQQTFDRGKDHQLVIAGAQGWFSDHLATTIAHLDLESQVRLTGFVPDDHLVALYNGAEAFVFPSIYEGFGLPVLEAMACGTPVITSNVSSLPEIVGEAGLLVDPTDPHAISQAIITILSDDQCKATLKAAGPHQARQFTWQRTAEQTYQVYQEAYQRGAHR
ncbi:glycosyltransferase, partial [candidate division KSB3 bacterium]|nr:glycosyltransferase [candidate division KSB3 bacterium]MBD3325973.1 glycosyltransferase [candidate division KSB3 bacterium]